jgi:carbamoyltransferase
MSLNIIGISALYHDSACCLIQDGKVIVAVQEERFTRVKQDPEMPYNAFKYCLESAGLSITDIDCVAYYEIPEDKLARQLWSGYDIELIDKLDPKRPVREIREILGYTGPIEFVDHHLSHAASSFYYSGFDEAAILTVDGVGEWATTTYGIANEKGIDLFEQVDFPDSIGLFYSTITAYLGFKVNSGEYKVMGLAPYGEPKYVEQLRKLVILKDEGQYELDMTYFEYISGEKMYSYKLEELLGMPPRVPESELSQIYMDVAKSLQVVLEEILLNKANYLYEKTKCKNLCMAGGVALNCVANGKILRDSSFENLFVQPASGDAGGALGAAAVALARLTNRQKKIEKMDHVYLGPSYTNNEIRNFLDATAIKYEDYSYDKNMLINKTAELIADGKVIGWFQGNIEFGPRALGDRSIIADPRRGEMRDRINSMVKKREGFRPFAPSVLESKMQEHFDLKTESPFMLLVCKVTSKLSLPAITHVDNSARVQSVNEDINLLYAKLIEEFDRLTGCPIILNTSFNVRGEPIVMSPIDAVSCFINTKIDCLVLGDFIIQRRNNSFVLIKTLLGNTKKANSSLDGRRYTFI